MDSALELRIRSDSDGGVPITESRRYLERSSLVKKLTNETFHKPLPMVWRLIACSEIPSMGSLPYTQALMKRVVETMWSGQAFSLDGSDSGVLSCYHSMVLRALVRLGYHKHVIDQAVDWLLKYQPFDRQQYSTWKGIGVTKYGGCFKSVPCYIGLAKATKALVAYQKVNPRSELQQTIDNAIAYILSHRLVYRRSNEQPIHRHILDLSFPESYQLNVVELLELMRESGHLDDPRLEDAKAYVHSRRGADGYWVPSVPYRADGYVAFDRRGHRQAEWLNYIISCVL